MKNSAINDDELLHLAKTLRLPGMRRMRDLVVAFMDEAIAREQAEMEERRNGKRGRPPKQQDLNQYGKPLATTGKGSAWSRMTPEERSREMKRRLRVAEKNRTQAESEQAAAKRHEAASRGAKARWAKMSKAAQKARMAQMRAGKLNKPSVKLEVAS